MWMIGILFRPNANEKDVIAIENEMQCHGCKPFNMLSAWTALELSDCFKTIAAVRELPEKRVIANIDLFRVSEWEQMTEALSDSPKPGLRVVK